MPNDLDSLLCRAASGEEAAREQIIESYRPFILREAGRACRRFLEWGRDEELSVALMAFNEAIDAYRYHENKHFLSLAGLVIKRRLIDYFRKNRAGIRECPLECVPVEADWEQNEREREVIRYEELLKSFNLSFGKVEAASPKHRQTREDLQRVVSAMIQNKKLMDYLLVTGKLPKKELCRLGRTTGRVLERGRIYIIALSLLLYGDEYPFLKECIKGVGKE